MYKKRKSLLLIIPLLLLVLFGCGPEPMSDSEYFGYLTNHIEDTSELKEYTLAANYDAKIGSIGTYTYENADYTKDEMEDRLEEIESIKNRVPKEHKDIHKNYVKAVSLMKEGTDTYHKALVSRNYTDEVYDEVIDKFNESDEYLIKILHLIYG